MASRAKHHVNEAIAVIAVKVSRTFILPDGSHFVALDVFDFSLECGDVVSLIGKSGYGKSTLLRMIASLDDPSTGSVTINGRPVELKLQNIGYETVTYGQPGMPSCAWVLHTSQSFRDAKRPALVSFPKAARFAWQDYLADPASIEELTVESSAPNVVSTRPSSREQAILQAALIGPQADGPLLGLSQDQGLGRPMRVSRRWGRRGMPPSPEWIDFILVQEAEA